MSAAEQLASCAGGWPRSAAARPCAMCSPGPDASTRPLVVLEAGSFGFSADWAAVQARLAAEGLRSLRLRPRRPRRLRSRPDAARQPGDRRRPRGPAGRRSTSPAPTSSAATRWPACTCACSPPATPRGCAGLVLVDATTPEAMDRSASRRSASASFNSLSQAGGLGRQRRAAAAAGRRARRRHRPAGGGQGGEAPRLRRPGAQPLGRRRGRQPGTPTPPRPATAGALDPSLAGRGGADRRRASAARPARHPDRPSAGVASWVGHPRPRREPRLPAGRAPRWPHRPRILAVEAAAKA